MGELRNLPGVLPTLFLVLIEVSSHYLSLFPGILERTESARAVSKSDRRVLLLPRIKFECTICSSEIYHNTAIDNML